jgi:hypothetical protein
MSTVGRSGLSAHIIKTMPDPTPSQQLVAVKARREQTITALCDHFANDRLTVEEFEQRLDIATRALAVPELEALLADLPSQATTAAAGTTSMASAPARHSTTKPQTLIAVMGGVERRGAWQPAQKTLVIAIMGGAVLDFREVQLPPGETEVTIIALMGGAEIIVPPDMNIDVGGLALMGGFSHSQPRGGSPPPGAPILKIDGFAMMGGVDVQVRLPGESESDARYRSREDRRRYKDEQRRLRDEWRRGE